MNRTLIGTIVSNKMQKTSVVEISRLKQHKKYKKRFKTVKRLKVHNEKNEYNVGDKVLIEETRPLSKEKRWRIVSEA